MTSKDPGTWASTASATEAYYYDELYFANAAYVKEKTLLGDPLAGTGKSSVVLGVPQTYPPKPLNGSSWSLLPDARQGRASTPSPTRLKDEIDRMAEGDYIIDVKDFRTDDKDAPARADLRDDATQRFKVVRDWVKTKDWDFFMLVEMGVDRIHHGYLALPRHRPPPLRERPQVRVRHPRLLQLPRRADRHRARARCPRTRTIWVVSDHGARPWRAASASTSGSCGRAPDAQGAARPSPRSSRRSNDRLVARPCAGARAATTAGLHEREGPRAAGDHRARATTSKSRELIKAKLEALADEKGNPIGTKAHKPQDIYRKVNNVAPDLIVYFGDLAWRSAGSVGMDALHIFENDTGPDDANHAQDGHVHPERPRRGARQARGREIYDVAPTVLTRAGMPVPGDMIGKVIRMTGAGSGGAGSGKGRGPPPARTT